MTRRLLSLITAVILSATAVQVRADATVLAALDWSALSWTTTGDVTVSLFPAPFGYGLRLQR